MPQMLIFTTLLAFYLAWNLGANDVANSMGTSVGTKTVTLKQALIIAGLLEFAGAVLFGQSVSARLATGVVDPAWFADTPQVLLLGMVAVLLAAGIWLNLATVFGLPVSSSHAVVGAIAGFACLAISPAVVRWPSLGLISVTWVLTPVLSAAIAAGIYGLIKHWILDQPDPIAQLQEWIPWLSAALVGSFGVLVLPTLLRAKILSAHLPPLPLHTVGLAIGAVVVCGLAIAAWRGPAMPWGDAMKSPTLAAHPAHPAHPEFALARLQLVSACCVAFAHGSNDVGNAIAPLATIFYIHQIGAIPPTALLTPLWMLVLGGSGIVAGLAVWGKTVITTVGQGIIALKPSGGFSAELATAATVLLASRCGLPVSTSHALVGAVIGVGLVQDWRSLQLKTLRSIGLTWFATIPIAAGLSATLFIGLQFWFNRYSV
jgi:inorganic phosphate transporter, PiT family